MAAVDTTLEGIIAEEATGIRVAIGIEVVITGAEAAAIMPAVAVMFGGDPAGDGTPICIGAGTFVAVAAAITAVVAIAIIGIAVAATIGIGAGDTGTGVAAIMGMAAGAIVAD